MRRHNQIAVLIAASAALGLVGCSSSSAVSPPSASSAPASEAAEPAGEAPPAPEGTRDNPAPIGSTITGKDWTVTVNSFTADAGAIVQEANQFNDAPEAGSHYSIVNYTVAYTGDDSAYAAEVSIALVLSSGEVINSYDTFVMLNDSMGMAELYNGGTATGSEVFTVPDGATVLIRVTPGFFADEVFVATE